MTRFRPLQFAVFFFALTLFLPSACPAEDYKIETVAGGLIHPWAIAFLPGGDMLVTEREGRLRVIRDGKSDPVPVANVPQVLVTGDGGLFDIVPDPHYETNGYLYLSYAHGTVEANATRVIRARLKGNELFDMEIIFTAVPYKDVPNHYGARLAFLPDDTLLITTGDGFIYREKAQLLDNTLGKTVRIHRDGSIPEDNPFAGKDGIRPEIWTYGHRNPQAILVVPDSGRVYLHEHGARGGDELNLIEPGKNYGWPVITHGIDYTFAHITPYREYPGMEQPLVYWSPSIAPAGMTWYDGDQFPEWRGSLFVAALVEQSVRRIVLNNGQVVDQEILFTEIGERLREVSTGPDGSLYILTDSMEGRVLRISKQRQQPGAQLQ